MRVLASSLLPERFPVLEAVPPKMGKTLGLESVVAWEGIGAVSEDKKFNFLHGAGCEKPRGGLEGTVRGRGERNRKEERQEPGELRSKLLLAGFKTVEEIMLKL